MGGNEIVKGEEGNVQAEQAFWVGKLVGHSLRTVCKLHICTRLDNLQRSAPDEVDVCSAFTEVLDFTWVDERFVPASSLLELLNRDEDFSAVSSSFVLVDLLKSNVVFGVSLHVGKTSGKGQNTMLGVEVVNGPGNVPER